MKKTKKKSPKKIIKLLIVLFVLLVVGLGIYYFLTSEDEENSLTILEKQWIENNKETLIEYLMIILIIKKMKQISYQLQH